jgi:DNA-binding transcriptional LysR family regulator
MLYLTLRHYEYVTAIARHGSLSAAANVVNVSQPALSVALSRIETHLGHRLFVRRQGAPMVLTPRGRVFVDRAGDVLAQAARLENPDAPGPAISRLSLGVFVDLAPFLLAPALVRLRETLSDVTVTYRVDDFQGLTAALLKGQIDLALTYDLGLDAGFDRRVVDHAAPYALVSTGHPLLTRTSISLADLASFPLVLFQEGLSAQHMLSLFRQHGLNPNVAHRADSLEIMRSLAAHGEGVGITYAVPPGSTSYDGMPVHAIKIADEQASEPIILTRHGTDPAEPVLTKAMAVLSDLMIKA